MLDPYDSATGERIEKQLNYLQLHSDCPVVSSCVHYIQDSTSRHIRPYINWTNSLVSRDDIFQRRFVNATVLNSTLMFRKSLMTTCGLFEDGEFPEDYEMILRWMSRGIPIHKLDEELIEWYDDEQRLSRRHLRYNSAAATKIKSKYFKKWLTEYFRTSPDILLWSNDSLSMKKVNQLESEGLNIVGYINENGQSKNGMDERPVFSLDEKPSRVLIVYYMEQFEPEEIPSLLIEKGLEEGVNFITMS